MRIKFDNYVIETCEGVYEPAEDSFALIDAISIRPPDGEFLDLGCGSGIIGIHVAKNYGVPVIFSDINPAAVRCAKRNSALNGIDGNFVVGDLLERLSSIDYVAFNPPYLPGEPEDLTDLARSGGKDGIEVILRFVRELKRVRKGAYLLTSGFNPTNVIIEEIKRQGLQARLLLHRIIAGEEYLVRRVSRGIDEINLNSHPGD